MDEMKPILHINAGVGWSATKPLCYTLDDVGYAVCPNRGKTTECNLLYYLYERQYKPVHANFYWHTLHKHRGLDFVRKNTTLDWYIEYIKSHIVKTHKGVSDFSNSNTDLPLYFLKQIAPVLEKEFDVRVTTIWRNPVRRSYSQMSAWYKEKWNDSYEKYPDSITYWRSQLDRPSHLLPDYVKVYNTWSSAFKKVYPVIMEEVWENPSDLSKFIGHKIEKMHANVYYPERGTQRPEIQGLKDQWSSDLQDLTEEDLQYGRNKLDWIYRNYKHQFKRIPESWQI
tara:strand:- start:3205 stop:4053 length:849 start_codon:yes stop_codon:yes gene_type:complete